MAETTALIKNMMEAENRAGKYFIFYCLMLFLLWWMRQEKESSACRGGDILWGYGLLSAAAALSPPAVYLFLIRTGASAKYGEALLLIPQLFVLAYGMTLICSRLQDVKKRRLCVAACIFVIAMSGTFLPYKGAAVKHKYSDKNIRMAVEAVSRQKEKLDAPVVLLAQQEILECARRYDGELQVLYGKDLWLPEANTAVADVYPKEYIFVFERVKNDYEHPDEVAALAERFGCNVVVLREKIPEGCEQQQRWILAEQVPGYYIYRIMS